MVRARVGEPPRYKTGHSSTSECPALADDERERGIAALDAHLFCREADFLDQEPQIALCNAPVRCEQLGLEGTAEGTKTRFAC